MPLWLSWWYSPRAALLLDRNCRKPNPPTTRRSTAIIIAISPRVAGHVLEVLVEDEQMVKKGDVLVKLDPKDFEIAVEAR